MIVYTPGDQVRSKVTGRCGIVFCSNMHGSLVVRFPEDKDGRPDEIDTTESQVEPILCPSIHYLEVRLRALMHKMFGTKMDANFIHEIATMLYNSVGLLGDETGWDNLA